MSVSETRTWGTILAGGLLALAAAGPLRGAEPQRPQLEGRWQLNAAQSEDARAKLAAARRDGERPGGGGRRGRWGGGGGGPGAPGGAPGRSATMQEFFEAPELLTIAGGAGELTLDDGRGRLVRIHPDGRTYKQESAVEIKADWKGADLVVETTGAEGRGKLTTTYRLPAGTRTLEVVCRLDRRRGEPVTVRRVYDAAPAPASGP